jgi:hypothetical protein
LAGALLFDEKIRQSAALFWSGLRDVGILYHNPKNYLCLSRLFGAWFGGGYDRSLSTSNRYPNKQEVGFIFA